MSRTARLVLLSVSLFFLLLPLAVPQPGLPATLKADEPAYYLMALSLARDGDLLCETKDLQRAFDAFPLLPIRNLILMSTDGWKTVYFGKPFLYSALAAPAAALAGDRGMVSFNMALLVAMIWMGFFYLRRFNPEPVAAFFSAAFFLLSLAFVYTFWLHTEILNMFSIAASLFFALHRFEDRSPLDSRWQRALAGLFNQHTAAAWSGAALALSLYNKPVLAILGVPAIFAVLRRRGRKAALAWIVALAVSLGAIAGASFLLIGKPTPYLGTSRVGVVIEDPEALDAVLAPLQTPDSADQRWSSWWWLMLAPQWHPRLLLENIGYFLWGRHTGLLLYMPFAVLSTVLFLVHGHRSNERRLVLASTVGLALFFLIWIFFNYHGGGGFIGNRYFASAYPAFLFLVTVVRPRWITAVGFVAAGLFLAPLLFTPYGAPVPEPTLQAHTRGAAFEPFPLELSVRRTVPGYRTMTVAATHFIGRQDLFRVYDREKGIFWVRGATAAEIWMASEASISTFRFKVSTLAPDNEVELRIGHARESVEFTGDDARDDPWVDVELRPAGPSRVRDQAGRTIYVYRLEIATATGSNPKRPNGKVIYPAFYLGAAVRFLGAEQESPS